MKCRLTIGRDWRLLPLVSIAEHNLSFTVVADGQVLGAFMPEKTGLTLGPARLPSCCLYQPCTPEQQAR